MQTVSLTSLDPNMLSNELERGKGYVLFDLAQNDLELICQLVSEQYLHQLQGVCPSKVGLYHSQPMDQYHTIFQPDHFDHGSTWTKPTRVLGPMAWDQLKKTQLIKHLYEMYPGLKISDEENFGWPNIYWRLVRPGNNDVGPVHADAWFWELGHGTMPDNHVRQKIWISLYSEPGKSGLRVVPESQRKSDWRYHGVEKQGMLKPVIDESEQDLDLFDLPLSAGQGVIFHDRLLHGGMPNRGAATRVSLEFTMLIPSELVGTGDR